jgi:charged multivesicular body protein 4
MMALKRKKMYEQQRENLRGARFNLESQVLAIENANVNKETIDAMRTGAQAMKSIHGELNIDKVENTMDDIREQMDLANEITASISQPLGMDMGLDMDELDAELEQLEQEELDATLLDAKAGPLPTLPAVATPTATAQPAAKESPMSAEERELEELRASMAL